MLASNKSAEKSILYRKPPTSLSCRKNSALPCRRFLEHPLFTTYLLVFTVTKVCNTSNKYWPPNKLAKQYFYARDLMSLLHLEKKLCSSLQRVLETSTFYRILISFYSVWVL